MGNDDIIQEGDNFVYALKVPKDRVAVFIGNKGQMKKQLKDELSVNLEIDSQEGDVLAKSKDSLKLYIAKDVLKAIARGFNPEVAMLLLKPENSFDMLDISEFATSKNSLHRLKGRVIGFQGKSWKTIETLTECYLAVYGKTICVIGELERVSVARRAIEALLSGSQHAAVYKWLERQRRNFHAHL